MSRLFEITSDYEQLFDSFDQLAECAEENGASLEELQQAWFDTLEGIEGEFEVKAENVALYIKEMKAKADAIKKEEVSLSKRRKACENRAERMQAYLLDCMQKAKLSKVDGVRAKITIRNNAPSLFVKDEPVLIKYLKEFGNSNLLRYKDPELNKAEIKAVLKAGRTIPGCMLVSKLSLTIK